MSKKIHARVRLTERFCKKFVDRGSRFLVTITNDAWFGKTAAAYQHFAMVTLRAIENRVAIARSANTGISGFIDPCGRILEQSDLFVEAALTHEIPLRTTTTIYTRYGDWFARLCLGLSLAGVGSVFVKNRKQR
jgi:apolipoprotein N-acyltransferase